jgi:hypothetical protein
LLLSPYSPGETVGRFAPKAAIRWNSQMTCGAADPRCGDSLFELKFSEGGHMHTRHFAAVLAMGFVFPGAAAAEAQRPLPFNPFPWVDNDHTDIDFCGETMLTIQRYGDYSFAISDTFRFFLVDHSGGNPVYSWLGKADRKLEGNPQYAQSWKDYLTVEYSGPGMDGYDTQDKMCAYLKQV